MYLLKANLVLAVLVLFYRLLLKREAAFARNRAVLLSIPALALLLPLVPFPGSEAGVVQLMLNEVTVSPFPRWQTPLMAYGESMLIAVLVLGALVRFLLFAGSLVETALLISVGKRSRKEAFVQLSYEQPRPVFSFFRYVHIPESLADADREALLRHELAHVRLLHSADLMYYNIMRAVFWMNPFVRMAHNDLRQVHEFQADAEACAHHTNYSALLLQQSLLGAVPALAHPFSKKSTLKTRIIMLDKTPSKFVALKLALLLPVVALLAMAMHPGTTTLNTTSDAAKTTVTKGGGGEEVDEMPQFPGGFDALVTWMGENIRYPKAAQKKGVAAKVVVAFTVDKEGNIINPKIKQGAHPDFEAEALRAVKAMPKWKPGMKDGKPVAVETALPIRFDMAPPPPPKPPKAH